MYMERDYNHFILTSEQHISHWGVYISGKSCITNGKKMFKKKRAMYTKSRSEKLCLIGAKCEQCTDLSNYAS